MHTGACDDGRGAVGGGKLDQPGPRSTSSSGPPHSAAHGQPTCAPCWPPRHGRQPPPPRPHLYGVLPPPAGGHLGEGQPQRHLAQQRWRRRGGPRPWLLPRLLLLLLLLLLLGGAGVGRPRPYAVGLAELHGCFHHGWLVEGRGNKDAKVLACREQGPPLLLDQLQWRIGKIGALPLLARHHAPGRMRGRWGSPRGTLPKRIRLAMRSRLCCHAASSSLQAEGSSGCRSRTRLAAEKHGSGDRCKAWPTMAGW